MTSAALGGGRLLGAGLLACLVLAAEARGQETAEPAEQTLHAYVGELAVETVASGLEFPWSLVFLPDGGMLVSEKLAARLRRVSPDGRLSPPIEGLPPIVGEGNGGLLGLALDPDFGANGRIYFAFSEPGEEGTAGLSVARAVLGGDRLEDLEIIFRQAPKIDDERDFGGRLVFAPDGNLFVLPGDRFARHLVQEMDNTIGKVVRIEPDGGIPPDNPFVGEAGVDPAIWSFGHRNIGGGIIHPETGKLWVEEFGPRGGDELNVAEPGRNYGWPLVAWGRHYSGEPIPAPPTRPDLEPSIFHWTPVISPSGMAYYTGSEIPDWQGNIIVGGLSSMSFTRLTLRGERVISEERIAFGTRVRDVVQGPDGMLYLLTDDPEGRIVRLRLKARAGE